jgi:uncharacterized Tic20 family protein
MSESGADPAPGAAPTESERTWGMLAHLAAFAGLVLLVLPVVPLVLSVYGPWFLWSAMPLIGNVAGPWLVWLHKRDQSAFVHEQALESLNFNITVSLAALICEIARLIYVGLLLGLLLFIAWLALTLRAAIKASEGVHYRYPFALRLVK